MFIPKKGKYYIIPYKTKSIKMKIFILNSNLQLYSQQQTELSQAGYRAVTLESLRL